MRHRLGLLALFCVVAVENGCGDDFHSAGFLERADTTLANNRTAVAMGLGDLDGDRDADVVVANSQNELNVLISKGDGSFATGVAYPLEQGANSRLVVLGDLSGDDRVDVLVANDNLNTISVFWNLGDGALQAAGPAISVNCRPRAVALSDMNGDRLSDAVVACEGPNEIHVLKNKGGQGGFDAPYVLGYEQTAGMGGNLPIPRSLAVAQLDADGRPDIVVGTDNDLRILISPAEGPRSYVVSLPLSMRAPAVAIGDVNGNGTPDLWALVGGQSVQVFEAATGGTFNRLVSYNNVGTPARAANLGLGVADFVKDGRSDFLVTLSNPAEVKLVVSRGERDAVDVPISTSYQYPMGLTTCDGCFAVGDVSGDGRPDVVLRNGTRIGVLLNASL